MKLLSSFIMFFSPSVIIYKFEKKSLIQMFPRTYNIFSDIQMNSNEATINWKVIGLVEFYKFDIQFTLIKMLGKSTHI